MDEQIGFVNRSGDSQRRSTGEALLTPLLAIIDASPHRHRLRIERRETKRIWSK